MSEDVLVGVDFGSSRIKAAAYRRDGRLLAIADAPTPLTTHPDGDDFPVLAMLDAAAGAVRGLDLGAGSIVGLAATSMGEVGTVLTGARPADADRVHRGAAPPGRLADLAFPSWYDARGTDVVEHVENRWGARALRDRTGRHTRTVSTLAKLGSATDVPAGTFLGLAGALAWQLTGRAWQEAALAASSGVYDVRTRRYLADVWASAGLGHVALPEVRGPGAWSPATTALAGELGLAPGAPVAVAGHDHPVASLGAGARPGEVVDSIGTGEAVIAVLRPELAADPGHLPRLLDLDPYLSVEMWPSTGELLVVWERMRPGLAMRTFLDRADLGRSTLDATAPPPGTTRTDTTARAIDEEVSLALEEGRHVDLVHDARTWGELVDYYVLLAQRGERLVREVTGAVGDTVLTGGGLRSPRWRAAKAQLATSSLEVSTVTETATRGCAAMVGVACGWWPRAEDMPGTTRRRVSPGDPAAMDRAAAELGG